MDDRAHRPDPGLLGAILASAAAGGSWRDAHQGWVPTPSEPKYPVPPHTMDPEQNALDRFREQQEFEEFMRQFQKLRRWDGPRDA